MSMRSMPRRLASVLAMLVLMAVLCVPCTVRANSVLDLERPCSLGIHLEKVDCDGQFALYMVGEWDERTGSWVVGDEFEACLSIDDFTPEAMLGTDGAELCERTTAFIGENSIQPVTSVEIVGGKDGWAYDLSPGLYFVLSAVLISDTSMIRTTPHFVSLPLYSIGDGTGEWLYDVMILPKYRVDTPSVPGETVSRNVLKVWSDDGHEDERPESVVVDLLRDGKVYDTATLSAENKWRYTWTLPAGFSYSVVEGNVPEGYESTVTRSGSMFTITNTYSGDFENPDMPDPDMPVAMSIPVDGRATVGVMVASAAASGGVVPQGTSAGMVSPDASAGSGTGSDGLFEGLSVHGGKIVDHTEPGEGMLQITKLVSDYTGNSDEWLGSGEKTYTVHVMAVDFEENILDPDNPSDPIVAGEEGWLSGEEFVAAFPDASVGPIFGPGGPIVNQDVFYKPKYVNVVNAAEGEGLVDKSYDEATGVGTLVFKDKGWAVLGMSGASNIYVWEDVAGDGLGPFYAVGYSGSGTACVFRDAVAMHVSGIGSENRFVTLYNDVLPRAEFYFKKTNSTGVGLLGAEFNLELEDGTVLATATSADGSVEGVETGIVRFGGLWLPEGVYYVRETKSPQGYQLCPDRYPVRVAGEWKESDDGYQRPGRARMYDPDDTDFSNPIMMFMNYSGVSLPSTGGPGTGAFYLAGALAMAMGIYFAVRRNGKCRRMARIGSRRFFAFLAAALVAGALSFPIVDVDALGPLDIGRECSISVSMKPVDGEGCPSEAHVDLYRIAEVDPYGKYTAVSTFSGCFDSKDMPVAGWSAEKWAYLGAACAERADSDGIPPDAELDLVRIGDPEDLERLSGCATNLEGGLWLIRARTVVDDANETAFSFIPFVAAVPGTMGIHGEAGDEWVYNVSCYLKPESHPVSTSFMVKVGFIGDEGLEAGRPEWVNILSERDGVPEGHFRVSAADGWTCSWDGYEKGGIWTLDQEFLESDALPVGMADGTVLFESPMSRDMSKTFSVRNDSADGVFVKAKALCPPGWTVSYGSDGAWKYGGDGWFCANDPIADGAETSELTVQLSRADGPLEEGEEMPDVPVVYRTAAAALDGSGNLYADWDAHVYDGPGAAYRFADVAYDYEMSDVDAFVRTATITYLYTGVSERVPETASAFSVGRMAKAAARNVAPAGEFVFDVMLEDVDGNVISGEYPVLAPPGVEIGRIIDGVGSFSLDAGGTFLVPGLPEGTRYEITERASAGWKTVGTFDASGTAGTLSPVTVVNGEDVADVPPEGVELPDTGGAGTGIYLVSGVCLLAALSGAWFLARKRRRA